MRCNRDSAEGSDDGVDLGGVDLRAVEDLRQREQVTVDQRDVAPSCFLSASLGGGEHARAGVDPDDSSARPDRGNDVWKSQAGATAKVQHRVPGLKVQPTEEVPSWPTVEQRLQRDQIVESTHGVVASPAPHERPLQ